MTPAAGWSIPSCVPFVKLFAIAGQLAIANKLSINRVKHTFCVPPVILLDFIITGRYVQFTSKNYSDTVCSLAKSNPDNSQRLSF
jgi:hypothetical protein